MITNLSYLGKSRVEAKGGQSTVSLSPNLARGKVFFDGAVKSPLRYREAMSALHAIVIGDFRFKKRSGGEAYQTYVREKKQRESALKKAVFDQAKTQALSTQIDPPPPDLDQRFSLMHRLYWKERRDWANDLMRNDPEMFRALVPCDPVITVAPDVVFFEGFAKDESSYGCLSLSRDAFLAPAERTAGTDGLGTTNVDYSLALYEQIQTLRTYKNTRLLVDPLGFDLKVEGRPDHREEKIDLPPSWLRGFGQIQAAMTLPAQVIALDVGTVYALLAFLARRREKTGPRSLRFELTPGLPPEVVIEPFEIRLTTKGAPYRGERKETIKVWGRRRLLSLARVLPLAERIEVRLIGSGLPSIWVVHMGEMQLTLAVSGWTKSNFSSGSALDLLSGSFSPDLLLAGRIQVHLLTVRSATLAELSAFSRASDRELLSALFHLAMLGQLIYDHAAGRYRFRPILPVELSEEILGPEHPELVAARILLKERRIRLGRPQIVAGQRLLSGSVGSEESCELALDLDGRIKKGRCGCSHYFRYKLRQGPCRHLLALRLFADNPDRSSTWWWS